MPAALLSLDPVPTLLTRIRAELAADFRPDRPTRISRAPGRLDVMGGIADYTGSLVCEMPLDRAAAVALQERDDRVVQVFSFNLLDEHKPFTLRIPLDALAKHPPDVLRREFDEPGRKWAAYLAGCLHVLHAHGIVDLLDPNRRGMSLAVYSTVPLGAGVSSSAALEVAAMMALCDVGFPARDSAESAAQAGKAAPPISDPMRLAALCQEVENQICGAPCGIMDQVTSCLGEAGKLLRMVCQPHELLPALDLPSGIRVIGIDSNVRHDVGAGQYGRTRCAAFMGHKIILDRMRQIGAASGRTLAGDPLNGYLANLDPDDYKQIFRPALPESIDGGAFLLKHGATIDKATTVDPETHYPVLHAVDHHVLEAGRVRRFSEFLEAAAHAPANSRERGLLLDKAGHLMYASHLSYTNDALLGAPECDLLVEFVRARERAGLYGAKITGGGSGGTVAILANEGEKADAAIAEIMAEYERQTGRRPQAFTGTSPGAWHVGTACL